MANNTKSNPMVLDTAAVIWSSGNRRIRNIQWIDNGDIVNDDDLDITINSGAITMAVQRHETAASVDGSAVIYEYGPFDKGVPCSYFEVVTIDNGLLIVTTD